MSKDKCLKFEIASLEDRFIQYKNKWYLANSKGQPYGLIKFCPYCGSKLNEHGCSSYWEE